MTWREIVELYRITTPAPASNFQPSWNVCPTQIVPIVGQMKDGTRIGSLARWGLIPPWCKDLKEAKLATINAKVETVRSSPLYRRPFVSKRCIVPASHWYEWQVLPDKKKQPYAIQVDGQPFGFAALWDTWRSPDGGAVESCTIVTTAAVPELRGIHNRMPRVLTPDEFDTWLQPDPEKAAELLAPSKAAFKFWKVDSAVGNVRNNHCDLINPL